MYLAILCLVILAQVNYSFGIAQCYEMASKRIPPITDALVERRVLKELVGGFENVYVPSWLDDITVCSAWFNLEKDDYLESKWRIVHKDKTVEKSQVELRWREVDNGVIEEFDAVKNVVEKVLYIVYCNRGVVAYIPCCISTDTAQHGYENAMVAVKEGLNWDDEKVVAHIKAAKAKLNILQFKVSRTNKCQPDNNN